MVSRHAVDRDRALLDAVAEHVRRRVDPDRLRNAADVADAVDVALDDVAAERLPRAERRLDVDAVVRCERAQRRPAQRLADDVERKPVAVVLDDGQADAVDRDRTRPRRRSSAEPRREGARRRRRQRVRSSRTMPVNTRTGYGTWT